MSFISSVFRVLTGALVLLGASVFLNISGETETSEAVLAMGAQAKERCIKIGAKRVCLQEGAKQKDDDDDDGDKPKGKTTADKCGEEVRCDPGYVVLEKPNKYGACCEPKEGFCPPDRPSGTPPNCCAEGTTFREGACWPTNCPPGTVGTPPHCQRTCGPGKVLVDQTCYDPCPAGTIGTPPTCFCPAGQDWDAGAKACKERPKCTGGMVGTPPNCKCPSGTVLSNGTCEKCEGGKVATGGECECPPGTAASNGTCRQCEGGRVVIDGRCDCPAGTIAFPRTTSNCVKGTRVVCRWRGTAPFCDGSCEAGEEYRGAGHSSTEQSAGAEYRGGFGSSCATGSKHLCCRAEP